MKSGGAFVYRVLKELRDLSAVARGIGTCEPSELLQASQSVVLQTAIGNHTHAVTSMTFSNNEDQIITGSIDKTITVSNCTTGDVIRVFTDSSPIPCFHMIPNEDHLMLATNSNAVMRVVNMTDGHIIQKLKCASEVRALAFDIDSHCFAGSKSGTILVLNYNKFALLNDTKFQFAFKVQLAQGGITHITFNDGKLYVNAADSHFSVVDCIYNDEKITDLNVLHRFNVAHSLLPLKNCVSGDYMISGGEDKKVHIWKVDDGKSQKSHFQKNAIFSSKFHYFRSFFVIFQQNPFFLSRF